MRKAFPLVLLAAVLVLCGSSSAVAEDLVSADIDPGDCEVFFETQSFKFDPGKATVAANRNWVIASCHGKLSKNDLESIGGPFKEAQHYWGFDCEIENDDTAEDLPAFVSHAVLSPSGVINVTCVAAFVPAPAE
jgi:hypothetical protein